MALLQVHQAKALRDLHEGVHDLTVLHELHAVTDLTLRATKVTAQSLGHAMSTQVVQDRHLWLCLVDMKEHDKVQSLNVPVSWTGLSATLSRALPRSSLQHSSRLTMGAPLRLPLLPRSSSTSSVMEPVADRTPSPSRPPPNPAVSTGAGAPRTTGSGRPVCISRNHPMPVVLLPN